MSNRLFNILHSNEGLSEEDFLNAQKIAGEKGEALAETLVRKNLVSEKNLLKALSMQYGLPVETELQVEDIDTGFTQLVPIHFLKKYFIVPVLETDVDIDTANTEENDADNEKQDRKIRENVYKFVINNPSAFQPLDDLIRIIKPDKYDIILSTRDSILSIINAAYDLSRDSAEQLVLDMEENGDGIISSIEETSDLLDDTSDAPIIKLVNHIISQSIKSQASDIHIEPYQSSFKVRYRIDGILYDLLNPPKWIQAALISRIKIMADLDIAEKRLPQDGRFGVKVGDQDIDIRVSTIPITFGERVVLRLLNKTKSLIKLTQIGLGPDQLTQIEKLIKSPNGIILVTGPTGSGKTTSLYAVLSTINRPDKNIITIEDPVEYQLKGIGQIQVNPKIELTFAKGLRSIVRQDPDVILIGEIRDNETAEIAVQSALTGHLVFSTVHTNDSASAITRLVDLGVEPFLISSSIMAIIAQRLVRILCKDCKEPYSPDPISLESLDIPSEYFDGHTIYRAKGCPNCFNTGYKGRIGIFEIMIMDDYLKSLILKTFDSNIIKKEAIKRNMTTLREDGLKKVYNGVTSIEEVLIVSHR